MARLLVTVLVLGSLLVLTVVYLRWRRRRLWWIHRQLRSAFVRSALMPLVLSVLMGLVLALLILTILTLQTLRLYPEQWLQAALQAGETCTVETPDTIRCGPCRLPQAAGPDVYWTRPGRWWVETEAFRRWWERCPGASLPSETLLVGVETDDRRLRWGALTPAMWTTTVEQVGIPLQRVDFLRARLDPTALAHRPDWTDPDFLFGLAWESHPVYAPSSPPGGPILRISAPYFWLPSRADAEATLARGQPVTLTGVAIQVAALGWVRAGLHTPDIVTNIFIKILLIIFFILLSLTGLATAGFLASGYWTARRIGRAVQQVEDAMRQVAAGRFPVRVPFYRTDQLGQLARQVEQTSQALAFLMEEKLSKDRLDREVEVARTVQRRLFPAAVPTRSDLDIAVHLTPARRLSGDYYDFLVGSDALGVVVADVAGKGLPASLLVAHLHALLHFAHEALNRPDDIVPMFRRIHRHLVTHTDPNQYVTLFYVLCPDGADRVVYLGAGHPPALYVAGDRVLWLDSTGPVLGALPESDWTVREVDWPPSALLVLYTDGLVEATGPSGQEYGRDRLAQRVRDVAGRARTAHEVLTGILADLQAWQSGPELADDALLVVLRRPEAGGQR